MVFVRRRKIKGKVYVYLEKSFKLPNGRVTKISKVIKPPLERAIPQNEGYFIEKEKELAGRWALKHYRFNYPLTEKDVKSVEAIRVDYRRIISELKKKRALEDLWDRFTVNFTYESNAIEGNSLTLKDVAIVIQEGEIVPGKTLREVYETRNSRPVVDLLLSKKIKTTHQNIIKIHKMLMRDIGVQFGYKKLPNFVLGSPVQTSPPERTYADMDKLIKWYHSSEDTLHPLQLVSLFHAEFLRIHPFQDGNGRVARFLLNAQFVNKGYPPVIIRKTQRRAYIKALQATDQGRKEPLIRFILEKFKKTYRSFFEVYIGYL